MRKIHKVSYWCIEYKNPDNGLITQIGNEPTWAALVLWTQNNLKTLPTGEGKMTRKKL